MKGAEKTTAVDIVNNSSRSSLDSNAFGLNQIISPNGDIIVLSPGSVDHKLERRICRKLDFRILPLTAAMYLFNALDKGNISNAKTDGLDIDIGISGDRWNLMLSIFYIPFVLFAFPISLVIKKYNACLLYTSRCV